MTILLALTACATHRSPESAPVAERPDHPCAPTHVDGSVGGKMTMSDGKLCTTTAWDRTRPQEVYSYGDGYYAVCTKDGGLWIDRATVDQLEEIDVELALRAMKIAPRCWRDTGTDSGS